jgi:hypothetical protein
MPVFAVIGAVTGIASGIYGASQADSQNRQAQDNYQEQKKQQQQIADAANEYNKRAFDVDVQNYFNQRQYQYDTAIQSWERGKEIQDYQYNQAYRQYQRSVQIGRQQLNFNDLAAKQAYAAEDFALQGLFQQQMFDRESQIAALKKTLLEGQLNQRAIQPELDAVVQKDRLGQYSIQDTVKQLVEQTAFEKENALVKNLQQLGAADLRQASRAKGRQATLGDFYRQMSQLDASLTGRQRQAAVQLTQLGVETSLARKRLGFELERVSLGLANAAQDTEFNLRVLDANIASAVQQSEINRKEIALQKYGADINAAASVMIQPERLSYEPQPVLAPQRIFIEPQEVLPGAVAQPVQQSVWGPLIQGIGSAAGSLKGVDWG